MVSRREWRAAYAERLRAQQQEESEHNEWLASRGLSPLEAHRPLKEYWPLPAWAAILMRVGASLVGLTGALGLWFVVGQLIGSDYGQGWLAPLLTAVVFLVPVAGLFWLATWMHSRAFAGRDPR
ncbi:hypothetical protein [Galactobacter valiniphilus]|uniref:hypothetical protein n=1 Tax=Galactobacter valiniphilus TaxID=2676122 RepID=UPI003734CD8C